MPVRTRTRRWRKTDSNHRSSRVEYLCFDWFCRLEGWKKPVQKSPPLSAGTGSSNPSPPATSRAQLDASSQEGADPGFSALGAALRDVSAPPMPAPRILQGTVSRGIWGATDEAPRRRDSSPFCPFRRTRRSARSGSLGSEAGEIVETCFQAVESFSTMGKRVKHARGPVARLADFSASLPEGSGSLVVGS